MFEKARDALTSLHQRGLLETGHFDLVAIRKQMESYEMLIKRSNSSSAIRSFLAEYDALMRLVEVVLICSGFRLGSQPHRVLKDVVDSLVVNSGIRDVAATRHDAKKMSIAPRQAAQDQLRFIRLLIESAVEQETKPLLNN